MDIVPKCSLNLYVCAHCLVPLPADKNKTIQSKAKQTNKKQNCAVNSGQHTNSQLVKVQRTGDSGVLSHNDAATLHPSSSLRDYYKEQGMR